MSKDSEVNYLKVFLTYFGFFVAIINGNCEELWEKLFSNYKAPNKEGYAPLVNDFEYFFTKRLFSKIRDCWDRY